MGESSNARNVIKLIRDLQRRKARERRSLVLLEGRRLVEDALDGGAKVVALLTASDADAAALAARAASQGASLESAPRKEFDELADTETPSGVLAVAEWEPLALDRLPPPHAGAVALVLDGIQDPGNVGTMIRTAHALGAWCTIALDGTADVRGPKVLRGAMGSHFRHALAECAFEEFTAFAGTAGLAICLAAADGTAGTRGALGGAAALVVGSEGHGVRAAWQGVQSSRIAIPMHAGAESLNAAVAAGILLFEMLRVGG